LYGKTLPPALLASKATSLKEGGEASDAMQNKYLVLQPNYLKECFEDGENQV
jgi:hypothetical protein